MGKSIIDDAKLVQLKNDGKTNGELAKIFDVSPAAITQRLQKLEAVALKEQGSRKDVAVCGIDVIAQMEKINGVTNRLLDSLVKSDDDGNTIVERPELLLKTAAELRMQFKTLIEVGEALYNLSATKEFQKAVIEEIELESPEAKQRIVDRLKAKNALARFFKTATSFN